MEIKFEKKSEIVSDTSHTPAIKLLAAVLCCRYRCLDISFHIFIFRPQNGKSSVQYIVFYNLLQVILHHGASISLIIFLLFMIKIAIFLENDCNNLSCQRYLCFFVLSIQFFFKKIGSTIVSCNNPFGKEATNIPIS